MESKFCDERPHFSHVYPTIIIVSLSIGYRRDVIRIKEFFEKQLFYRYYQTTENCNRATLLKDLTDIRDDIQDSPIDFDRLVCFVLSHGEKVGYTITQRIINIFKNCV